MPSLGWQLVLLLTVPPGGTLALDLPPGHPRDAHVCLASGANHLGLTSHQGVGLDPRERMPWPEADGPPRARTSVAWSSWSGTGFTK
jgi:hypothetical protein